MTLPYSCHLISEIELQYQSASNLPKWLIKAFRYPRLIGITSHKSQERGGWFKFAQLANFCPGTPSGPDESSDVYKACFSILKSHGYTLVNSTQNYTLGDAAHWTISPCLRKGEAYALRNKSTPNDVLAPKTEDATSSYQAELKRTLGSALVYYISLFDDLSQNYEWVQKVRVKGQRVPCRINKNSKYEMLSSLRDCLIQLKHLSDDYEAVCITDEYSAILSHNDVLITRAQLSFRNDLINSGVQYMSIYDEIIYRTQNATVNTHGKSSKDIPEDLVLDTNIGNVNAEFQTLISSSSMGGQEQTHLAKMHLLNSLGLPPSEEFDVNTIRVRGRSNCHKLFNFLEKKCLEQLMLIKGGDATLNVRLVLSNFPIVFSKVQEARVSLGLGKKGDKYSRIILRGFILPGVLNKLFTVFETLQSRVSFKTVHVNVVYNTSIDAELHEQTLHFSKRNRIFNNFCQDFKTIQSQYPACFKSLRKMVPFSNFIIYKGRVNISTGRSRSAITNSSTKALPAISDMLTQSQTQVQLPITIMGDFLYDCLQRIKMVMVHSIGADYMAKESTVAFLRVALDNISCIPKSLMTERTNVKLFKQMYAGTGTGNQNFYSDGILPGRLVNLIWLLGLLLHTTRKMPFVDVQVLENEQNAQDGDYLNAMLDVDVDVGTRKLLDLASQPNGDLDIDDNIAEDNLQILSLPLCHTVDPYDLDLDSLHKLALAQSCYIIHLVHSVRFQKFFQRHFGKSYAEFNAKRFKSNDDVEKASPRLQHAKVDAEDLAIVDSFTMEPLRLADGWQQLVKRAKSRRMALEDENKKRPISNAIDDVNFDSGTDVDVDDDGGDDSQQESGTWKSLEQQNALQIVKMSSDSCSVSTASSQGSWPRRQMSDLCGSFDSVDVQNRKANSVNVGFGVVSTISREHGRVHHCTFNFDSKRLNGLAVKHFIQKLSESQTCKSEDAANHVVFVLLATRNLHNAHVTRMIRDLLNSDLILLNPQYEADIDVPHEATTFNVEKFTLAFKRSTFPNGGPSIYTKQNVSHSIISNVKGLEDHLVGVVNHHGYNTRIRVQAVCLGDLHATSAEGKSLHKQCKLVASVCGQVKKHHKDVQLRLSFKGVGWFYECFHRGYYLTGTHLPAHAKDDDFQRVSELHRLEYSDGKIAPVPSNVLVKLFEDLNPKASYTLEFNDVYKDIGTFWGLVCYLSDIKMSALDVMLFYRHCGIQFKASSNIAGDISADFERKLQIFGITLQDLVAHFHYARIYSNTLILTQRDPRKRHKADEEDPNESLHVRPMVGSCVISYGNFDGVPTVNVQWLLGSFVSAEIAPLEHYLVD